MFVHYKLYNLFVLPQDNTSADECWTDECWMADSNIESNTPYSIVGRALKNVSENAEHKK